MGAVFDAQFQNLKNAFARSGPDGAAGPDIRVEFDRAGDPLYLYEADSLLVQASDGDALDRVNRLLPGLRPPQRPVELPDGLAVLSLADVAGGRLTVPEALDLIDADFGDRHPARTEDGSDDTRTPPASPVHVIHIAKICPAGEPSVPSGAPTRPWPDQVDPGCTPEFHVRVGVSDTGLAQPLDLGLNPWLDEVHGARVAGEDDPLGPPLRNGFRQIPEYTGHGLFIAGVVRCTAPGADVFVNNHFTLSGGELETVMIAKLDQLVRDYDPHVVNLSAGTYTRNNWLPLGLTAFAGRNADRVLVAAAGNDSTDRPFYPAALPRKRFPQVVSVGALGTDLLHPAWFSNFGPWVDVFAPGEGIVNAFPVGEYVYQEPPRRPNRQRFGTGLAMWDGTSFSAPFVAGMIADRIARTGESPRDAAAVVLAAAQPMPGVGQVLLPGTRP